MTLILSGTNGLSDVDGDASTPAVRGTDANSGIFFGADQVGVATNGVERVEFGNSETVFNDGGADVDFRVESDTVENALFVDGATGNVGIGNTGNSSRKVEITQESGQIAGVRVLSGGSGAYYQMFTGTANTKIGSSNNTNQIEFHNDSGEAMRIDSSGNLLVGTTSLSGSSSNTVDIVGGNFKTFSNSGSIAGSTTATVLTLSSSVLGVYIVQANFGAQANQIYTGMLIIAANANSFRIVTDGSGTNSVMTLSGANVQLANAIGSALDFTASAIFIGS
jgi:hypothetical protein